MFEFVSNGITFVFAIGFVCWFVAVMLGVE
jgi:hypothetical protein